ncbi:hypothetical protein DFA_06656 [Cavenderia fasciculata]|uniref:Uncharacterized protein n=1 Tax=Cavenderia fasciculata TaxID=261658 RepID=F4Q1X0_CACFS|nr:uncharacterized protein DFA_06656 [Cavenderia fasciculata]EGG17990.1 hypothetical protein DFA_06656 [Cavenderia fasciculata]|eukprot:XP_004356882.1 hypothetical protein DFA_06656 [Cavenderia fasciculata]
MGEPHLLLNSIKSRYNRLLECKFHTNVQVLHKDVHVLQQHLQSTISNSNSPAYIVRSPILLDSDDDNSVIDGEFNPNIGGGEDDESGYYYRYYHDSNYLSNVIDSKFNQFYQTVLSKDVQHQHQHSKNNLLDNKIYPTPLVLFSPSYFYQCDNGSKRSSVISIPSHVLNNYQQQQQQQQQNNNNNNNNIVNNNTNNIIHDVIYYSDSDHQFHKEPFTMNQNLYDSMVKWSNTQRNMLKDHQSSVSSVSGSSITTSTSTSFKKLDIPSINKPIKNNKGKKKTRSKRAGIVSKIRGKKGKSAIKQQRHYLEREIVKYESGHPLRRSWSRSKYVYGAAAAQSGTMMEDAQLEQIQSQLQQQAIPQSNSPYSSDDSYRASYKERFWRGEKDVTDPYDLRSRSYY